MTGRINWPLVFGLAALALVRPVMSMLGLLEKIGQPLASISVTIAISIIWIVVVVVRRVDQPHVHLTITGIAYGLLAIVTSAILSPILEGQLQGPITNPFAIVSVLITNAIWGLVAGLIAAAISKGMQAQKA